MIGMFGGLGAKIRDENGKVINSPGWVGDIGFGEGWAGLFELVINKSTTVAIAAGDIVINDTANFAAIDELPPVTTTTTASHPGVRGFMIEAIPVATAAQVAAAAAGDYSQLPRGLLLRRGRMSNANVATGTAAGQALQTSTTAGRAAQASSTNANAGTCWTLAASNAASIEVRC